MKNDTNTHSNTLINKSKKPNDLSSERKGLYVRESNKVIYGQEKHRKRRNKRVEYNREVKGRK